MRNCSGVNVVSVDLVPLRRFCTGNQLFGQPQSFLRRCLVFTLFVAPVVRGTLNRTSEQTWLRVRTLCIHVETRVHLVQLPSERAPERMACVSRLHADTHTHAHALGRASRRSIQALYVAATRALVPQEKEYEGGEMTHLRVVIVRVDLETFFLSLGKLAPRPRRASSFP